MRCSDVELLWEEMWDGGEPQSEHAVVHLRSCRHCQDLYRQFEGVAYCLSCLPIVEPPPSLVPRILDHIKTVRKQYRHSKADAFARIGSPLADLFIAWRDSAITFVGIDRGGDIEEVRAQIERRLSRPLRTAEPPGWVREAVQNYFRTWHVDLDRIDVSELTEFERAALRKAAEIPPGEVRSYGWIAREIGHPQAARAVGQAMARNPVALFFPCHRVVDSTGALHRYGYGVELKARILSMEGYRKP